MLATYPPQALAPAPRAPVQEKKLRPAPVVPSDWWDNLAINAVIEWRIEKDTDLMWRAAEDLNLERKKKGKVFFVYTTLEELVYLISWAREYPARP